MDRENLHGINNNSNSVRLVSLRDWKQASEFPDRDNGGPYMVTQEGYDPTDPKMDYDEFVLGKSGEWVTVGIFLRLPRDVREQEFVYGTAAEVIHLLESLTGNARIMRNPQEAASLGEPSEAPKADDLTSAFQAAKKTEPQP